MKRFRKSFYPPQSMGRDKGRGFSPEADPPLEERQQLIFDLSPTLPITWGEGYKVVSMLLVVLLIIPILAQAAPAEYCNFGPFRVPCPFGTADVATAGPAGGNFLGVFVQSIIDILLLVAGSVSVIFLMVGAYRYITAHGNEEQAEAAKKTMTSAILGLIIVILSFVIIRIIATVIIKGSGELF